MDDIALNSHVRLKTKDNMEISQNFFCRGLDDSIVLEGEGSTQYHKDFTIVKGSFVSDVQVVLDPNQAALEHKDVIPTVDADRTKLREDRAVKNARLEAMKIGEGVTEEAQVIFNALSKTLPCRWNGKSIVVLEEIEISEPYGSTNCNCIVKISDHEGIDRVRKVLEEERKKLKLSTV
eukprot:jgi/Picsp_1/1067/NSC_04550-R1_protein